MLYTIAEVSSYVLKYHISSNWRTWECIGKGEFYLRGQVYSLLCTNHELLIFIIIIIIIIIIYIVIITIIINVIVIIIIIINVIIIIIIIVIVIIMIIIIREVDSFLLLK